MDTLFRLHADIEERIDFIRQDHADWLCRMGCDGCCRRLAAVPRLTEAEWVLLREGLAALPSEQLQEIDHDMAALAEQQSRPYVCPLLDRSAGACRVYLYRPVACRTYGFYVDRDQGLYCKDIEAEVENGCLDGVVWGNQDVVDRRLKNLGTSRDLTQWFASWREQWDF